MDDAQLIAALQYDEQFSVIRELSAPAAPDARATACKTELVMRGDVGPYIRKRIPIQLANRDAWQELTAISHPLLPHVEAVYELPDQLVVVTEFVVGQSLAQMVSQGGRFLPGRCEQIMSDLCSAASALHERGIVHRDITPGNVIISPTGAHLIDLGIARIHEEGASRDTTTLGTWGFAAPEQFGFAQTDARSDVYSLGRILGYMLTGLLPNDSAYEQALRNSSVVPARLAAVIGKACAFEPSARYQSATELQQALESNETPSATSAPGLQQQPKEEKGPIQSLLASAAPGGLFDLPGFLALGDFAIFARGAVSCRSILKQIGCAAIVLVALLWDAIFISTVVHDFMTVDTPTLVADTLFLAAISLFCVTLPARDACMALLRVGRYEREPHPWRLVLARLLVGLVLSSLALLVSVLIVSIFVPVSAQP